MSQVELDPVHFPMPRVQGCPFHPPQELRDIQSAGRPVRVQIWNGTKPWLITGHDRQRSLLTDERLSSDPTHPQFPFQSVGIEARRARTTTFIQMDNPEHNHYRRMLTGQFTAKRMEAMRESIQEITDRLLDELQELEGPVDLVEHFALPLPSLVICQMLGVPYESHELFQEASATLLSQSADRDQVDEATVVLRELARDLIAVKRGRDDDDIISHLVRDHLEQGELTEDQVVDMSLLLLVAVHETTANQIALGTLALLENPEQRDYLQTLTDRSDIARAVDEMMRFLSIAHVGRRRVALEDIQVDHDVVIRKGEGVIFPDAAGNWDPDVYERPDTLDLAREGAGRHMAFGFGTHQCLGQPLARVELQIAYTSLFARLPTLRLHGRASDLKFREDMNIYGVYALPVTW